MIVPVSEVKDSLQTGNIRLTNGHSDFRKLHEKNYDKEVHAQRYPTLNGRFFSLDLE